MQYSTTFEDQLSEKLFMISSLTSIPSRNIPLPSDTISNNWLVSLLIRGDTCSRECDATIKLVHVFKSYIKGIKTQRLRVISMVLSRIAVIPLPALIMFSSKKFDDRVSPSFPQETRNIIPISPATKTTDIYD